MVYVVLLLVLTGLYFALQDARGHGMPPFRVHRIFWPSAALLVAVVMGSRVDTGVDYPNYVLHFRLIGEDFGVFFREPIYTLTARAIHGLGGGVHAFLFVLALVTNLALFMAIPRLRPSYPFLVVLGLFGADFILAQTNAVRQMVAIGVIFASLPLIAERRLWGYTASVALAAGFHYMAVVVYPLYWFAHRSPSFPLLAILLGLSLPMMVLGPAYYPALLELLDPAASLLPERYQLHLERILAQGTATASGLGTLGLWAIGSASLVWLQVASGLRGFTPGERVAVNTGVLAIALNTMLAPIPVVGRLADFFLLGLPLLASVAVASTPHRTERMLVYALFALAFVTLFGYGILSGSHGAYPYDSLIPGLAAL